MKLLYVAPSFYPASRYGGPIAALHRLCLEMARAGHAVRVLTTDADGPRRLSGTAAGRPVALAPGLEVRYCRRLVPDSVSCALARALPAQVRWADVVHLTAAYSFPTLPTLVACRLLGRPLVWSPRGAWQRWEGSTRLRSKALWDAACRAVAPPGTVVHATSEDERRDSAARMGLPVAVVPNGVDVPPAPVPGPAGPGPLRLLYLGRLDPKKGIERLLAAVARLREPAGLDVRLVVAGGGAPRFEAALRREVARLGLGADVALPGHVEGEAKERCFAEADVLVLPSHTENFGLVVAEALARGLPVIASRGTPWSRLESEGCGLWVDNDAASLAAAIRRFRDLPWRDMAARARAWAEREFAWPEAARAMEACYRRQAAPPPRAVTGRALGGVP